MLGALPPTTTTFTPLAAPWLLFVLVLGRVGQRDLPVEDLEDLAPRDDDRVALLVDDRLARFEPRDRSVVLVAFAGRQIGKLEQPDRGQRVDDRRRGRKRLGAGAFVPVVDLAQQAAQRFREVLGHLGMIERIGLRLRIVLVHPAALSTRAGKHMAWRPPCRAAGNHAERLTRSSQVFTTLQVRRGRAALAVLLFLACALSVVPLASPAAVSRTPTKRALAAKKPAPKKKAVRASAYHPHMGLAPADEYFGRLGMSVLGVRNKVKDLGLDADYHPEHDKAVLNNALWVEDAMRDWAKKYPFDRWLPRYAYALEQMYERIPGDDAHKRALKQIAYITAYFPQTQYGKVGRAKLAEGVPTPDPSDTPQPLTDLERLALLDGKVQPTIPPAATPTPVPVPTTVPTPSAAPSAEATDPAAKPSTSPAVSGTPAPSATPRRQP